MTTKNFAGAIHAQEYVYDFAENGGAQSTIDLSTGKTLPIGAIVFMVLNVCETAVVGASATIAFGDGTTTTQYMNTANATVLDALNETTIALPYVLTSRVSSANTSKFTITIGTADITAGKIRSTVLYYLPSNDDDAVA